MAARPPKRKMASVFVLTFVAYVSFHVSRKTLTNLSGKTSFNLFSASTRNYTHLQTDMRVCDFGAASCFLLSCFFPPAAAFANANVNPPHPPFFLSTHLPAATLQTSWCKGCSTNDTNNTHHNNTQPPRLHAEHAAAYEAMYSPTFLS